MNGKIKILPGNPNDANRDYLPMAIKGTDMVVNENGNNSQVYPERLKEFKSEVLKGFEETWYEYVPESYDGTEKVPLVVSMHGGAMTGWGQAIYTCWTMVADREGFILLFPNAHSRKFWMVEMDKASLEVLAKPRPDDFYMNIPPDDPMDNHDMNSVIQLIKMMRDKYNIDESRIYMQGMSMGNMMTSQFAMYHGDILACMGGSAGPTCPEVIYDEKGEMIHRAKPVAVWQSRCELDKVPFHHKNTTDEFVKMNRNYWKTINGCYELPEIKISGEDNFAFYKGKYADIVFRDIKNRDHGQTLDDAELVWDYLYSGIKRGKNGEIIRTESILPRKGDRYAIALSAGSSKAYLNNELVRMSGPAFMHQKLKYHGLDGDAKVRGEYFMAPVSFAAKALEARLSSSEDGCVVEMTLKDGREMQFARGIIGCLVDGKVQSMYCEAVLKDGELYVPIEWVCRKMLDNHVSRYDGVLYITDHYSELSVNMSHILRDEVLN